MTGIIQKASYLISEFKVLNQQFACYFIGREKSIILLIFF